MAIAPHKQAPNVFRDPLTGTALPLSRSVNSRAKALKHAVYPRVASPAATADELKFRILRLLSAAGESGASLDEVASAFPAEGRKRIANAIQIIRGRRFAASYGRGPGAVTKITPAGNQVLRANLHGNSFGALPCLELQSE